MQRFINNFFLCCFMAHYKDRKGNHGGLDKVARAVARAKGVHLRNGHRLGGQQEVTDEVFREGGYTFLGRMQIFCSDFQGMGRAFLVRETDGNFTLTSTPRMKFVRQGNGWSVDSASLGAMQDQVLPISPVDAEAYEHAERVWGQYA
jgi:hypothetical protein